MQVVLLGAWALIQPWLRWPTLAPDVSHRMTLVLLAVALGLSQLPQAMRHPMPLAWWGWIAGLIVMLGCHAWPTVSSGGYFDRFHETAAFSDGLLVAVALAWGLWAAMQLPRHWLRRLRWAGVAMCGANLVAVAYHCWSVRDLTPGDNIAGLMGLNRFLGIYAVAWLPVLFRWRWWLAILPILLVGYAGKTTAWMGLAVAAWFLCPRGRLAWASLAIIIGLWVVPTDLGAKLAMRLDVWSQALTASLVHPFLGVGFSPLTGLSLRTASGYALPSLHSDILSLALRAGWPLALVAVGIAARVLCQPPRTDWASALRASLAALAAMACLHGVLGHARIAGLALLLLAWWFVEQETAHETT